MTDNVDETFNEEKKNKVLAWLDEKWPKERRCCEICGSESWTLAQDITVPLVFEGSIKFGGATYPQISVICNNCGNTKNFNAVMMGVLQGKNKEGGK